MVGASRVRADLRPDERLPECALVVRAGLVLAPPLARARPGAVDLCHVRHVDHFVGCDQHRPAISSELDRVVGYSVLASLSPVSNSGQVAFSVSSRATRPHPPWIARSRPWRPTMSRSYPCSST